MSLITQCPACSTMFRVVPDQLRISDGWVRCGKCDEVFDANAHLRVLEQVQVSPPASSQTAYATGSKPEQVSQHVAEVPISAPFEEQIEEPSVTKRVSVERPVVALNSQADDPDAYDWGPALSLQSNGGLAEIKLDVPQSVTEVEPQYVPADDPFLGHSPQEPTLEHGPLPEHDGNAPLDEWGVRQDHASAATLENDALVQLPEDGRPAASTETDEVAPSFMAASVSPSWWNSGAGRKTLLGACFLLLLTLALQLLVSERDHLAARAPALQPLLASACEVWGCTISPLQQIEAIAIDSSTFSTVKPGVYLLKVTLKNGAAIDLATPALELTLTDTQDQPLLRRVVLPAELNAQRPLAAGADLTTSLPVGVSPGAVPQKISGYKLLAFYP